MHAPSRSETFFSEPRAEYADREPDAALAPRRVYIKQADLDRHGYATGCQKCELLAPGQPNSKNRSDLCGRRIMEEIAKTDEGNALSANEITSGSLHGQGKGEKL